MFEWIYWSISAVLLFWHSVWDKALPGGAFVATNWQWILGIIFLVVTIRIVLFPVFVKQIKSQRAMQALQPKVKELQEKHKGDRETLQKEMMELYRKEKANPLMGCLPMFLQIPVFFGLFHVLNYIKPDQREKDLYGWSLDQFNSAASARLFDAPIAAKFQSTPAQLAALNANGTTVKVVAGLLVVIMILTTYLTSRQMILKTGWAEDPQQKMIQRLMLYGIPFSLLISGAIFPIGVIIYWVTNNLFSLGQQQWVLRKYPPPPMANKGGAGGKGGAAGKGATGGKAASGKAAAGKPAVKTGKDGESSNGKTGAAPAVDGRALAPKPGAKPVRPGAKPTNPKKGGAKRPAG